MAVGALDLGSNSFHLLVARVTNGQLFKLGSQKHILGIGAHVQHTGKLPEAAFEPAVAAVEAMVAHARTFQPSRILAVGTSALRDASNAAEFSEAVSARTGVNVEIVSGDTEARLVYTGARSGIRDLPPRLGVVDIGGGSIEVAVGREDSVSPLASLPLGFLRLGRSIGLGGAMSRDVARELVRVQGSDVASRAREFTPQAWVFSGGTARAFGHVARRHAGAALPFIPRELVLQLAKTLVYADETALAALGVDPARIATLGAGAAVLAAMVELLDAPSIGISPGGLREGIVLREVAAAGERRRLPSSSPFAAANF